MNLKRIFDSKLIIVAMALIIAGMLFLFVFPSLLSDDYTNIRQGFRELGVPLVITGVISIMLDSVALTSMKAELIKILNNSLQGQQLFDYGLSNIVQRLTYDDIYKAVTNGKNFDLVQTWSPNIQPLLFFHAKTIFRNGGKIRIFLLNPDTEYARQRSADLKLDADKVPNSIRGNIDYIKNFYKSMEEELIAEKPNLSEVEIKKEMKRIELRLYSSLPTCSIYKVDNKAWMGFYWLGKTTDESINLIVSNDRKNNIILEAVENQIGELVKRYKPVDINTI
ncbi:MAG: hypothetical protein R3D71_08390 [Rickettsiales bacterium]